MSEPTWEMLYTLQKLPPPALVGSITQLYDYVVATQEVPATGLPARPDIVAHMTHHVEVL